MSQGPDIPLESRPELPARVRFRLDPVTADPLLLYPEGVLILNATAADIVQRCDGKTTVAELLAHLATDYEIDSRTLTAEVLDCLADLSRRNLLIFLP